MGMLFARVSFHLPAILVPQMSLSHCWSTIPYKCVRYMMMNGTVYIIPVTGPGFPFPKTMFQELDEKQEIHAGKQPIHLIGKNHEQTWLRTYINDNKRS